MEDEYRIEMSCPKRLMIKFKDNHACDGFEVTLIDFDKLHNFVSYKEWLECKMSDSAVIEVGRDFFVITDKILCYWFEDVNIEDS